MYIIVSYDVSASRCNKVMKIYRKYLFHVHNSVFEGYLTNKEYLQMKKEIERVIDKKYDSIIYYKLVSPKTLAKETINSKEINNIII